MVLLKQLAYGSPDYQETIALRNTIMREPLGLSIYDEDLTNEKEAIIIGAFSDNTLLGVGIAILQNKDYHIDYICVDTRQQQGGIGRLVLNELEKIGHSQGAKTANLAARLSAQGFYEKQGYHTVGKPYIMPSAPVGHIRMEKSLV